MDIGFKNILTDNLETDFKAEVVAAELIDNGVPADQVMIQAVGSMKRAFRKDVDNISEEVSEYRNKEYTIITTHKEGIYDMLPEGLFHTPTLPKSASTQAEIIEHIQRHKVEERNARRFFLPYEAAINHLRIQMALYESRLDKGTQHTELVDIFKNHWSIFKLLDTKQSNIFLQIMPLIHDIRDDYAIAATVFESIFSLPVSIEGQLQQPFRPESVVFSSLNDTVLGSNFTTGNELYFNGEDEVIVTIGPLTNEQLKEFMPGTRNYKILEALCDHLLPVHVDMQTRFELVDSDKATRLADSNGDHNSVLGLSTFLRA